MTEEGFDVISEVDSVSVVPEDDSTLTISKNIKAEVRRKRRNITGHVSVPSRYLSSPLPSCHDSCKHGTKHVCETKPRVPLLKRIKEKKGEGNNEEEKQDAVQGPAYSSGSKCQKRNISIATERTKLCGQQVLKPPIAPSKGDKKPIPKQRSVLSNCNEETERPTQNGGCAKRLLMLLSASSHEHKSSIDSPKDHQKEIMKSCQNRVRDSKEGACIRQSSTSSMASSSSSSALASSISKQFGIEVKNKAVDTETNAIELKLGARKISAASLKDKDSVPRKLSFRKGTVVEIQHEISTPRRLKFKRRIVSNRQNRMLGSRKSSLKSLELRGAETTDANPETKGDKIPIPKRRSVLSNCKGKTERPTQNGGRAKRLSMSLSASSHEHKSSIDSPKDHQKGIMKSSQNRVQDSKDGARIRRSSPSSMASSSSSSALASSIPKEFEIEVKSKAVDAEMNAIELKPRARKIGAASLKDDSVPRKLNFRKGTVVEIQHAISTPRRLKFRRRIASDRQNRMLGSRKSSLKSLELRGAETANANPESKKVVLRSQNMKGKETMRSLFNNVIEETANKLVQSRKSKVKALVGAFETVISLQEAKPASTISAC